MFTLAHQGTSLYYYAPTADLSFSNAKIPEHRIEHILHIDEPRHLSDSLRGVAQLLGSQDHVVRSYVEKRTTPKEGQG